MLRLTELITYARDELLGHFNFEGGAFDDVVLDNSRLKLPCFYISMQQCIATEAIGLATNAIQTYKQDVKILYVCKNVDDRTGKFANDSAYFARLALMKCFYNKYVVFNDEKYLLHWESDAPRFQDNARYMHEFTYSIIGTFTPHIDEEYLNLLKINVEYDLTESTDAAKPNATDEIDLDT